MLIELILLLVLVFCVLSGYRKGLLMSLCTLLILVLCCLGASAAQQKLTPPVVEAVAPMVQQTVEMKLQEQMENGTQQAVEEAEEAGITIAGQSITLGDLVSLLQRLGLDVEAAVTERANTALEPAAAAAAEAVTQAIVQPLVELIIYLLAFLILYLVLHSVALAVNVVDRLPVIHTLNRFGGAALGFFSGMLLLTVLLTVFRRTGWIPEGMGHGLLGIILDRLVAFLA